MTQENGKWQRLLLFCGKSVFSVLVDSFGFFLRFRFANKICVEMKFNQHCNCII